MKIKRKKSQIELMRENNMRYRVVLEEKNKKKNKVEVKIVTCHVGVKGNIEEYANYYSYDNKSTIISIYR